jgi:hypothetical protein
MASSPFHRVLSLFLSLLLPLHALPFLALVLLGFHWTLGDAYAEQRRLHASIQAPVLTGHLAGDAFLVLAGFAAARWLYEVPSDEASSPLPLPLPPPQRVARTVTLAWALGRIRRILVRAYPPYAAAVLLSASVLARGAVMGGEQADPHDPLPPAGGGDSLLVAPPSPLFFTAAAWLPRPARWPGIGAFHAPSVSAVVGALFLQGPGERVEVQAAPFLAPLAIALRFLLLFPVLALAATTACRFAASAVVLCTACAAQTCLQHGAAGEDPLLPSTAAAAASGRTPPHLTPSWSAPTPPPPPPARTAGLVVPQAPVACRACTRSLPRWASALRWLATTTCGKPDAALALLLALGAAYGVAWRVVSAPVLEHGTIRYTPRLVDTPFYDAYFTRTEAHLPSFCAGALAAMRATALPPPGVATPFFHRAAWATAALVVVASVAYDASGWLPLLPTPTLGPIAALRLPPSSSPRWAVEAWDAVLTAVPSFRSLALALYLPLSAAAFALVLLYTQRSATVSALLRLAEDDSQSSTRFSLASVRASPLLAAATLLVRLTALTRPYASVCMLIFAPAGYVVLAALPPPRPDDPGQVPLLPLIFVAIVKVLLVVAPISVGLVRATDAIRRAPACARAAEFVRAAARRGGRRLVSGAWRAAVSLLSAGGRARVEAGLVAAGRAWSAVFPSAGAPSAPASPRAPPARAAGAGSVGVAGGDAWIRGAGWEAVVASANEGRLRRRRLRATQSAAFAAAIAALDAAEGGGGTGPEAAAGPRVGAGKERGVSGRSPADAPAADGLADAAPAEAVSAAAAVAAELEGSDDDVDGGRGAGAASSSSSTSQSSSSSEGEGEDDEGAVGNEAERPLPDGDNEDDYDNDTTSSDNEEGFGGLTAREESRARRVARHICARVLREALEAEEAGAAVEPASARPDVFERSLLAGAAIRDALAATTRGTLAVGGTVLRGVRSLLRTRADVVAGNSLGRLRDGTEMRWRRAAQLGDSAVERAELAEEVEGRLVGGEDARVEVGGGGEGAAAPPRPPPRPPLGALQRAGLAIAMEWAEGAQAGDDMLLRVVQLVSDGLEEERG